MKIFPQLQEAREWEGIHYVIADKGYDYFDVRHPIKKAGKIPVIPRRANAVLPELQDIYKPYYNRPLSKLAFSLKQPFLASLTSNFLAISSDMSSKLADKSAQKLTVLMSKANFERGLILDPLQKGFLGVLKKTSVQPLGSTS